MRIATNKKGGHLASPGAVTFNFDRKGLLQISKKSVLEDELFALVSEAGAEDFDTTDDLYIITTAPDQLFHIKEILDKHHIKCESAELEMLPKTTLACSPEDTQANLDLIEWIENLDDVDAVYHNMQLSEG